MNLSSSSSKSTLFGSICLLCLRTKTCTSVKSDPEQHCRSQVACVKYIVLISKYLKLDSRLTKISNKSLHKLANDVVEVDSSDQVDFSEAVNKFVLCDGCLPKAELFCTAFKEFEVWKLKLENSVAETVALIQKSAPEEESKLGGSRRIVKRVAKPTSCSKEATSKENTKEEVNTTAPEDILLSFRTKLKETGSTLKNVSIPKVCLKRNETAEILAQRKLLKMNVDVNITRKDGIIGISKAQGVQWIGGINYAGGGSESQFGLNNLRPSAATFDDDVIVLNEESNIGRGTQNSQTTTQVCGVNGCDKTLARNVAGSATMLNHLHYHDNLNCNVCNKSKLSPMDLAIHELTHSTNDQPFGYKCARCSNFSSVRSEYQEHFINCHYNSSIEVLKCPTCKKGYTYTNINQYHLHSKNCHPEKFADKTNCHECDICHVYFKKQEILWKHVTHDHRINNHAGAFRCNYCAQSFFCNSFLEMHTKFSCERPNKYLCPDTSCIVTCNSEYALKSHVALHGPNLQLPTCPICQRKILHRDGLTDHMMTHNGEQVKIVFPNGRKEGQPVIIPIDKTISGVPVIPPTSQEPTPPQPDEVSDEIQILSSSLEMPSTSAEPMFSPVITAVTGNPIMYTENVLVSSSQIHCPPAPTITTTIKPEDISKFLLEESEDSEQLMDFGGCGDNPDEASIEDPFAWLLPDGDGDHCLF
ncbi:unnamed protein product [Orchesella dallaii]|uniref:C2H2-type domain-containing protein n=1 Tax=Orchesella dallaii TaxID=48710 RepID=A0ABP1PJR8_9HEXA